MDYDKFCKDLCSELAAKFKPVAEEFANNELQVYKTYDMQQYVEQEFQDDYEDILLMLTRLQDMMQMFFK